MQPIVLFAVAGAGALGAVARYLATLLVRHWGGVGPVPVACVNIVGCFGFGLCWAFAHGRWSHPVATAVLAGFFGAFTTFSAFAFDGFELLEQRRIGAFVLNALVQNGVGLLAVWMGIAAGPARS